MAGRSQNTMFVTGQLRLTGTAWWEDLWIHSWAQNSSVFSTLSQMAPNHVGEKAEMYAFCGQFASLPQRKMGNKGAGPPTGESWKCKAQCMASEGSLCPGGKWVRLDHLCLITLLKLIGREVSPLPWSRVKEGHWRGLLFLHHSFSFTDLFNLDAFRS